ncbi:MAG: DUF2726 domain-containing protein [Chloroflexota bacterium]
MSSNKPGCLGAIFGIKPRPVGKGPAQSRSASVPVSAGQVTAAAPRYASKGILLTNAEASFYHVLRNMTRDYLVIFPHVALRDLVTVIDQSEYFAYYNKIDRKQVDFVLCDPNTLKPVFVIELDDSSHKRPDRQQRDTFLEEVLKCAGIPLIRVPVKHSYDPKELGMLFKGAINQYATLQKEAPNHQYTADNPPFCPKHGVRMILRTAHRTGEKFWGCPNYPQCHQMIKLQGSPN